MKRLWQYSQKLGADHPGHIPMSALTVEFGVSLSTVKRHLSSGIPIEQVGEAPPRPARAPRPSEEPRANQPAPRAKQPTPADELSQGPTSAAEPAARILVDQRTSPEADSTGRRRSRFYIKPAP